MDLDSRFGVFLLLEFGLGGNGFGAGGKGGNQ
jgi:hypothetical protein